MSSSNRTLASACVALVMTLVLPGCSSSPLTTLPMPGIAPPGAVAPEPPSRLSVSDRLQGAITPTDSTVTSLDWQLVSSIPVPAGVDTMVTGSHYALRFYKGSLAKLEIISIKEYDRNVIDVQFGPHGTRFVTPVELSIDFAGTNSDPRTANADPSEPVLWYLNETTNRWEEVMGGTTDWVHLKYIVHLEHFSRYVLGGKAGWKHSPNTESDN